MSQSLQKSINAQRAVLHDLLSYALGNHVSTITSLLSKQEELDEYLSEVFDSLDHCKFAYVLDENAVQISSTINRYGADNSDVSRDRSTRPYMQHMHDDTVDFSLSEAYISHSKKRPSLTAIQSIDTKDGKRIGFLGVDFDLRELPLSDVIYEEPRQWRQIKGDPAIRQGLFSQERIESLMDQHIDTVMSVHEALIRDQGVHHIQIHFSSSRSTIWHTDDPYVYRLLTMDELSDTNICLAYPRRSYFDRAVVPASAIPEILDQFKALRFADETVYLRSGSLNIVNGKIGLNFSCDGTHYIGWDEFLSNGLDFWFGGASFPEAVVPAEQSESDVDTIKLDESVETYASQGCVYVNRMIKTVQSGDVPEVLSEFETEERKYIYDELVSIMDVYEDS